MHPWKVRQLRDSALDKLRRQLKTHFMLSPNPHWGSLAR
jgi:hypothetical protein